MTVKAKLSLNVMVVLVALSVIVMVALYSARATNKNISELTEKTTPYQLKALQHQKELQAHTANLINLAASKTMEEFQKTAPIATDSLKRLMDVSQEMGRLRGERSKEDRVISEITKTISEKTESKIRAQESAILVAQPIGENLSKSLTELKTFLSGIIQKGSLSKDTGMNSIINVDDQIAQLNGIKDGIVGLIQITLKIAATSDKRLASELKDHVGNCIKKVYLPLKNWKGTEKNVQEISNKAAKLQEHLDGLVSLQIKSIGSEDRRQREMTEAKTREVVLELMDLLEMVDKEAQQKNHQFKGHIGDMLRDLDRSKSTNEILALTSEMSLLNASIISHINQSIHEKKMKALDQQISLLRNLFDGANKTGEKMRNFLLTHDYGDGMFAIMAYQNTLREVSTSFFDKGGVAEKLKTTIQNGEELDQLNSQMRTIVSKHLEMSQQEVSKAGINQEEVVVTLNRTARRMVLMISVVGGLIALIALFMGILISRSISKPIHHVVQSLSEASEQLTSASGQVSSASQSMAEGASEQAAGIEETSSSIEEMASMAQRNAEHARETNLLMEKGIELMKKARRSMKAMVESIESIEKSSEETGKIIKAIDEIAFQTNLLALNAAVEAARAGEAGAGFAVVADEVRNLAMRAAEAAQNTSVLIKETIKRVQEGAALVHQTDESYREVGFSLQKTVGLIKEIADASREQAVGIEQISKALNEMDRVVQKNAASAEESASAAEEMNGQAEQMRGVVEELMTLVSKRSKGENFGDSGEAVVH